MSYRDLFLRVADHVRGRGVDVELMPGPPLSNATVDKARRVLTIPLPESLVEFYREMGDGMLFHWDAGGVEGDDREPFAVVEVAPLLDVVRAHEGQKEYATEWRDDYDYRFTDDPRKARATALRVRRWLGFHHEGNGDRFCLDTAASPGPVVFDRHDWYDGGTGDNGAPMGDTLRGFMEGWSRVCFQCPSSLYWPSVLGPAGVDWQCDEFDPRFRLPRETDRQLRLPM